MVVCWECECVHACKVECGTVSMLKHGVVTLPSHTLLTHAHSHSSHTLHSHTHMSTPLQEDKCHLLPQLKPVPTEGEEGEREREEPLLNKMVDHWMSTRDLMKVCTCTCIHTQCWPQRMCQLLLWYCPLLFGVVCIPVSC